MELSGLSDLSKKITSAPLDHVAFGWFAFDLASRRASRAFDLQTEGNGQKKIVTSARTKHGNDTTITPQAAIGNEIEIALGGPITWGPVCVIG